MAAPQIREPLPRGSEATSDARKWREWILAGDGGHGPDWQATLRVGPGDADRLWKLIHELIREAPVTAIRDRGAYGIVCEVLLDVSINDRSARVVSAWHYADIEAAPRLVTAYPRPIS